MNRAGYESNVPSCPSGGWYPPEREAGGGDTYDNRVNDNKAIKSAPEDIVGGSSFLSSQCKPRFSQIDSDVDLATLAFPDDSLRSNEMLQSMYNQPYERRDQYRDSYLGNQGALVGHATAYETLRSYPPQQIEAAPEHAPIPYTHSYDDRVPASLENEWVKIGLTSSDQVGPRLFPHKYTHNPQHGVEGLRDNHPAYQANSMSYDTMHPPNHEAFEGTENYQGFSDGQFGSCLNLQSEPWSAVNPRNTSLHNPANEAVVQAGSPETIYSVAHGFDHLSSGPEEILETLVTSLNSDKDELMRSFDTIRAHDAQSHTMEQFSVPLVQKSSTLAAPMSTRSRAEFRFEVRDGTPREGISLYEPDVPFKSRAGPFSL